MLSPWLWHPCPWAVPLRQTSICFLLPLTPIICTPTEPWTGSSTCAPPHSQPCRQQSALGCLGRHNHHPKTRMCTFWDGFAPSPTSLGSTDTPFISCPSSHFNSATLRFQKYYDKKADLALRFWHCIGRTTKPFLNSEIRCDSSFSWLILTPRLWLHALSSFKWNYH